MNCKKTMMFTMLIASMSATMVRALEVPTPVEATPAQGFKETVKNGYGTTKAAFGKGAASVKQSGASAAKLLKANPIKTGLAGVITTGLVVAAVVLNDKENSTTPVVEPVVEATPVVEPVVAAIPVVEPVVAAIPVVEPVVEAVKVEETSLLQRGVASVKSGYNTVYESAGKGCKSVRTAAVNGYDSAKTGFTNVTTEYPYALPVTAGLVVLAAVGYVAYQYFGTEEVQNS